MSAPLVVAITVNLDTVEDDEMGSGYRTDGVVYINGTEVFRKDDLGWIDDAAIACTATADEFARRLAEVLLT